MATISNTPRPGYVWDATDNCWYPIGTGPHSHADYITAGSAINPNIVDAKGDIIAATAADTVARLAVGSNDQVLTADSSTATGLKWATPSAGGMTLISTTDLSGSTTTLSSIPQTYTDLRIIVQNPKLASGTSSFWVTFNNNTNGDYLSQMVFNGNVFQRTLIESGNGNSLLQAGTENLRQNFLLDINIYTDTTYGKPFISYANFGDSSSENRTQIQSGIYKSASAISSIEIKTFSGSFNAGRVLLYGVK